MKHDSIVDSLFLVIAAEDSTAVIKLGPNRKVEDSLMQRAMLMQINGLSIDCQEVPKNLHPLFNSPSAKAQGGVVGGWRATNLLRFVFRALAALKIP